MKGHCLRCCPCRLLPMLLRLKGPESGTRDAATRMRQKCDGSSLPPSIPLFGLPFECCAETNHAYSRNRILNTCTSRHFSSYQCLPPALLAVVARIANLVRSSQPPQPATPSPSYDTPSLLTARLLAATGCMDTTRYSMQHNYETLQWVARHSNTE